MDGTLAMKESDLRRVIETLLPDVVEKTVAMVVENHMPKPPKLSTWEHIKVEWTKPSGLIPAVTFLSLAVVGGIATFNAVHANTETNDKQACQLDLLDDPKCDSAVRREIIAGKDRDAKLAAILDNLPREVERLADRQKTAEQKQSEELAEWRGWRRGIDQSVIDARDTKGEVGRLTGRADAQDQRSSRIFDTLQASIADLARTVNGIDKKVDVMGARDDRIVPRRQSTPAPAPAPSARPLLRIVNRSRPVRTVGLTRALERVFGPASTRRKSAFGTLIKPR